MAPASPPGKAQERSHAPLWRVRDSHHPSPHRQPRPQSLAHGQNSPVASLYLIGYTRIQLDKAVAERRTTILPASIQPLEIRSAWHAQAFHAARCSEHAFCPMHHDPSTP